MSKLFISHSSKDDGFVRALREALEDQGYDGWIDSRQLRGGALLWPEIQEAIDEACGLAVVVSSAALQSKWVGKESKHALGVQRTRGKERFPVIPVSLDGTKLGVLEEFFGEEPVYIPAASGAGGDEAVLDAILVAMGKRLPADRAAEPQPKAEPVEELVLHLTDLKIHEEDGKRRATARARLVYEPATPGQPQVASPQPWRLTSPLGLIEAEELRWYLEKYAIWPSGIFREHCERVEANLAKWGQALHTVALPVAHTANVMAAWAKVGEQAGRRFSVEVDAALESGASEAEQSTAREAATLLLGLPWELLHDDKSFLFQGTKAMRVRRRLPNIEGREVPVVAPPIRILLVTARPEDDACGYIDHRANALPLVEAMEALGGLVKIRVLDEPTLSALGKELETARAAGQPYHVIHFDGHGVYDRKVGLGGLCFEDPTDLGKLEQRGHKTVFTTDLGPLLKDHRVPLVFLEACHTATAEKAAESVASAILKEGVVSVVAMSHSVLVETARKFVEAFYGALAAGKRVGSAMLVGQRALKDDSVRGRIFGVGELCLQDWFVPVLYQEKDDPQLFKRTPARQTRDDILAGQMRRMGDLREPPKTGFVGRSRELLALQRLLATSRYAVIRGQGGEGKTALATEFARWMVRSQQVRRAAFICVEGMENNIVESVLDRLGQQLCKQGWSTQADCGGDLEKAEMTIDRALRERRTLLVVDNMESILPPPFVERHEALVAEAKADLDALLALCQRLSDKGDTRIVFTSRERLPVPFDGERERRELGQLAREDAVALVEKLLGEDAVGAGDAADAQTEEIERLVDAVHCHARTLALLAPSLRSHGVEATRESLAELMAEMEKRFPGDREKSVYASVELSLQRMSAENRERARVLAVFHGGVVLDMLRVMMEWKNDEAVALARELVATGLATADPHHRLSLDPALCPYLRLRMNRAETEVLTMRWTPVMRAYVRFLVEQQESQHPEAVATLAVLELPNLLALLDREEKAGYAESTIDLASDLCCLLQRLGKSRMVASVSNVRDKAAKRLVGTWNHACFDVQMTRIGQQLSGGEIGRALEDAKDLLQRARAAGVDGYPGAEYDLALACWFLARALNACGDAGKALGLLGEARTRFEAIAGQQGDKAAEGMALTCLTERGDSLRSLGRLDEAASAYEEAIELDDRRGAKRDVAVGKTQLGSVRLLQRRFDEASEAYRQGLERFTQLDEPGSVATCWHQIGRVFQELGQPEAAEDAYRQSLAISVRLGDVASQASTLGQLGVLYDAALGRTAEAAEFAKQAADKFVGVRHLANEGVARSDLANRLRKLRRFDEARQETRRAIECKTPFGHVAEPWKTWSILAIIETESGDLSAAAAAKQKAIDCYLAYRRDGGENHNGAGRLVFDMRERLAQGGLSAATAFLQQLATRPDFPVSLHAFVQALQAVLNGSRDRNLANAPDLDYTMAAEILLLIENLDRPNPAPRR